MAEQAGQISTGKKVGWVIFFLFVATGYFTLLDWFAMNIQGLDYFYMFRK